MQKSVFFCAGDLSGDIHCALLVRELLERHPDWDIRALGGAHMRAAGAQLVGDTTNLGVIGFVTALFTLPRQFRMKQRALRAIAHHKPDLVVLCDWGGFNARFLPHVKAAGLPVLWYFPPSSWRKKGPGGLAIAPLCDAIATPFSWSRDRLNEAGGKAQWVGHPLLEVARPAVDRAELRRQFGVPEGAKLVTLLPGSRPLELRYVAPHIADAVRTASPQAEIHWLAVAPPGKAAAVRQVFGPEVHVTEGNAAAALAACDAAIVKSGTSTLEAAIVNAPQVVVYELPPVLFFEAYAFRKRNQSPLVAMPNIILDRAAVPELLCENCRGPRIASELLNLLGDSERTDVMKRDYALVREALGEKLPYTATHRTADMIDELVGAGTGGTA